MTQAIKVFVGALRNGETQSIEVYGELTELKNGSWEWVGEVEDVALPMEAIVEGTSADTTLSRAQELVKSAIEEVKKSHSDVVEDDWLQGFWEW